MTDRRTEDATTSAFELGIAAIAAECVVGLDAESRIILFNPAAERTFGWRREEVLDLRFEALLPERTRAFATRSLRDLARAEDPTRRFEGADALRCLRKDDLEFQAELTVTRTTLEGSTIFTLVVRDITERERVESELRRSAHLLAESERIAGVGSWMLEPSTGVVTWSREMYRIHGVTPDSFVPTLANVARMVAPEDREQFLVESTADWWRNVATSTIYRIDRPEGGRRVLHARAEVDVDADGTPIAVVGTVEDLTAENERALRESNLLEHNEQLALVIEGTRLGFWDWNPKTGVLVSNPRLAEMIGFQPEEVGATLEFWEDRVHPEDFAGFMARRRAHIDGRTDHYEHVYRLCHRDGHWIHVLDRGRVFDRDDGGRPTRFCGTYTDITGEKEAEQIAVEASRAKTQFLTNMSHELRTPLNAILGLSEAMLERTFGDLNTRQERSLQTVFDSGHHLLSLINDVLDIARVESGMLSMEHQPSSLKPLVDDCLAMIFAQAQAKGSRLLSDLEPGLPELEIDRRRIKQVLVNLVGNAIKFSPPRGAIIIKVRAHVAAGVVEISVSDEGPGIPAADQERIFEPFVALDQNLTREYGGAGLGLALIKRIVELHGGRIRVESREGAGATFFVEIPIPPPAPLQSRSASRSHRDMPAVQFATTVLLVEDNPANVMTIQGYLESLGYVTRVARDGVVAVEEARKTDVGVILMDIQLPRLDGLEAMRRIRAEEARSESAPKVIVALTANAMPSDRDRCLSAGANAYLSKPVRLRDLSSTISQFLQTETTP